MIALIQRVTHASVEVRGACVGRIAIGLLALVCAERGDGEKEALALLSKLLAFRVFADDAGKMNRSVPQFTLAADTQAGTRPSFTPAAPPDEGRRLFDYFVAQARVRHPLVETGQFGAEMQVSLTNDGPVTFWLQIKPQA
jgi:D-tyrosyl-tRNA(Tyr) deacylase